MYTFIYVSQQHTFNAQKAGNKLVDGLYKKYQGAFFPAHLITRLPAH